MITKIDLVGHRAAVVEPLKGGGVSVTMTVMGARVGGMALTPDLAARFINAMQAALKASQA